MRWVDIELKLKTDANNFGRKVKELAPKNSSYIGLDNGKLVDYIYVEGKRVRTNSNNLYNSINTTQVYGNGKSIITKVVVDSGKVPYYDAAVLKSTREVALHYGRTEYGSKRYGNSRIKIKQNRNYLYYMLGEQYMIEFMGKWNGRTIKIEDSIEVFR